MDTSCTRKCKPDTKTCHVTIELGVREPKAKRFTIITKRKERRETKKKKGGSKDAKTHMMKKEKVRKSQKQSEVAVRRYLAEK